MTSNAEVAVPVWELILTRMGITWLGCYLTLRYKKGEDALWVRTMSVTDTLYSIRSTSWPKASERLACPER